MEDPTPIDPAPARRFGGDRRTRLVGWWSELPGNVRGGLWMLVGGFFLTVMVALVKILGARLHITEILLFRQTIMIIVVLPTIAANFPSVLKTSRYGLHAARVTLATMAMLFGFTAAIHLPLADATAIGFARSLFVTVFAIIFLKEVAGPRRWAATLIGFVGVLLMLRPGSDAAISTYGLMAVAGTAGAGGVMIILRILSRTDRPVTILTYQALLVGLIMLVPAIWHWQTPTLHEFFMLIGLGVVSWAGQMCNIQAYRAGEATAVAAIDYTRLIYAVILGGFIFAQWPGANTLIGAAIIIAASFYTLHRENVVARKRGLESAKSKD
ncbi:MAG: EamA/RhaT family transporter [Hyphomicrobiales bacterium]|nr:MAG: EamA/RhaT family transporter [Hyphomicrobiales bacterium]